MLADCVVIGGGIIGLLTALELSKTGMRVTLIDRAEIGQESSWAGGGILSPLYPWQVPKTLNELIQYGSTYYQQLAPELLTKTGIDPQWICSGQLILDQSSAMRELACVWGKSMHRPVEIIEQQKLKSFEPAINSIFHHAISLSNIAQIRNPRLLRGLKALLPEMNVRLLEQNPATTIQLSDNYIHSVSSPHHHILTQLVVICSGAWSRSVLEPLHEIDIFPAKGQMILFDAKPDLISHIILHEDFYLIPRKDGKILAGSTVEYVGFDKTTTLEAKVALREKAYAIIPKLKEYRIIHHWAGLRPASRRVYPIISAHPDIKGLFINTGHFRNGVACAPGSAQLLKNLVLGELPIVDPGPFSLRETVR